MVINKWDSRLGGLLGLLGLLLQGLVDGCNNSTAAQGNVLQEGAQVVVVADGKGEGTGADTLTLSLDDLGGELEKLSGQVLQDGSGVDSSGGTNAAGIAALAEEGSDATNGEDQSSLGGLGAAGLLARLLGCLGGTLGGGHFVR
jgi:hypothetical protein